MHFNDDGMLAFSVMKSLLLIGGIERNPGPKCKVVSHLEEGNHAEGTVDLQDMREAQCLRKRVDELEAEVLAANVLRVTELANQRQEYEQRLLQQQGADGQLSSAVGRLQQVVPKGKVRLLLYLVLMAVVILVLLRASRRHHIHGYFWSKGR